jgi:hypothetical protein
MTQSENLVRLFAGAAEAMENSRNLAVRPMISSVSSHASRWMNDDVQPEPGEIELLSNRLACFDL